MTSLNEDFANAVDPLIKFDARGLTIAFRMIFVKALSDAGMLSENLIDRAYKSDRPFGKSLQWIFEKVSSNLKIELFDDEIDVTGLDHKTVEKFVKLLSTIEKIDDGEIADAIEFMNDKENGAVFTPDSVVDLMTRVGIAKTLKQNHTVDENEIDSFVFSAGPVPDEVIPTIQTMKFCDPSMGAGAFIIGSSKIIAELISNATKIQYSEALLQVFKWQAYGVDVMERSVDVTKLRVWLNLIDAGVYPKDLPRLDNLIIMDAIVQLGYDKKTPFRIMKATDGEQYEILIRKEQEKCRSILTGESGPLFLSPWERAWRLRFYEDGETIVKSKCIKHWSGVFRDVMLSHGGFDMILGNPPYIRSANVCDPFGEIEQAEYYKHCMDSVYIDWPEFFGSGVDGDERYISQIDKRSDLFTFFFLRTMKLLKENGTHMFICSTGWLESFYGGWMQEFLLKEASLDVVIDNHAVQTFDGIGTSAVITQITLPKTERHDDETKFVVVEIPYDKLMSLPHEARQALITKWQPADGNSSEPPLIRHTTATRKELLNLGTYKGEYTMQKWRTFYLKTPEIYNIINQKYKDKLVRLGDLSDLQGGISTGGDKFYFFDVIQKGDEYCHVKNKMGWEGKIETRFLRPVMKRIINTPVRVPMERITQMVLDCQVSKDELDGTKVLEYIEWGEQQEIEIKGKKIIGFHNTTTAKSRDNWYSIEFPPTRKVHFSKAFLYVAKTYLIEIDVGSGLVSFDIDENYLPALNSAIFLLIAGIFGRDNLGGLMAFNSVDLANLTFPDLKAPELMSCLDVIGSSSIFNEYGVDPKASVPIYEQPLNIIPERKRIDDYFFDFLGMNDEERAMVYRTILKMMAQRLG
jgi:hypothetical protein